MVETGVEMFGLGNFSLILDHYPFDGRTESQLEAMWKLIKSGKVEEEKEQWDWTEWHWNVDWEWDGLICSEDPDKDDWPPHKYHGPESISLSEMREKFAPKKPVITNFSKGTPNVQSTSVGGIGTDEEAIFLTETTPLDMDPIVDHKVPILVEGQLDAEPIEPEIEQIEKLPKLPTRTRVEFHQERVRALANELPHLNRSVIHPQDAGVIGKHLTTGHSNTSLAVGDLSHFFLGNKGALAIAAGIFCILRIPLKKNLIYLSISNICRY
jgi:hypothetical protein